MSPEKLTPEELDELHAHVAYGHEPGASQLNDHVLSALTELRALRSQRCETCRHRGVIDHRHNRRACDHPQMLRALLVPLFDFGCTLWQSRSDPPAPQQE